ncbi:MAG: beta-N-acetylhexosaminidase [Kangiellaceae bacterium]|jgi:beta-N-acetylhexosaminidase|nr:beta-N-acetylhexosaminidase [Kangiellaceae bacterium]
MRQAGPIMMDLESSEINQVEREMLQHPATGGVILFARNIESAQQVQQLNQQISEINPALLLAVDQEGGRVQRLKDGFTKLPPLRLLESTAQSITEAQNFCFHHARLMALETLAVGFDISFTPVLDVATSTSRVIGDRAFHEEPDMIGLLAAEYIKGMASVGMAATGKHFPGHGFVDGDSHHEIPVDDRSISEISEHDLKPFASTAQMLGGIMPAHVIYSQVDDLPAGFSSVWIKDILRQQLQFNGVVFSDDLSMKGAEVVGDFIDRANAALQAGCDMVLVCNNRRQAERVIEHLSDFRDPNASARIGQLKSAGHYAVGLSELQQSADWATSHKTIRRITDTPI